MERPHGHILLAGMSDRKVDKELLTVTNYMYGVFASQLVVGNVDSNPLLDATNLVKSYAGRHQGYAESSHPARHPHLCPHGRKVSSSDHAGGL